MQEQMLQNTKTALDYEIVRVGPWKKTECQARKSFVNSLQN